jgi:magnesium and cobalt transporter
MIRLLERLFRTGRDASAGQAAGPSAGRGAGRDAERDAERDAQRDADEQEMIQGVQELGETTVKEVMVPRIDTVLLPLDLGEEELLEKVVACGHSRIPVYSESIDSVVGILYAKDLLRAIVKGSPVSLPELVRKPFFVPESKRIDSLLKEFRRKRVHIAVVVDEYGGVSGIVCLEDIIEEIVGEIQDEFDEEREDVVSLGESSWLCDARADLDDINRETGLSLPADEYDTLGGYVFALFEKIPSRYERASSGDLDFTVQDMEGHRITSVKIARRRPAAQEE